MTSTTRDVYVINADGSGSTRLMLEYLSPDDPAWSPDGRKIAITAIFSDSYYGRDIALIQIVTANGIPHSTTITEDVSQPAWRP